jgi:predicted aspartyl protease
MKRLFALILSVAALAPFTAQSQPPPGTLAGFLSGQGLVGVKLERRFGNHLFVPSSINNKRAALMIDTGAPVTIIDKNSAGTFGLNPTSPCPERNPARVPGGLLRLRGKRDERRYR